MKAVKLCRECGRSMLNVIVAAPRGAKTGTQGLDGSRERSIIPKLLCEHVVEICEEAFT